MMAAAEGKYENDSRMSADGASSGNVSCDCQEHADSIESVALELLSELDYIWN